VAREGPVTIEGLAPGGRGLARLGGRAVFVSKAAPGDVCTLKVEHESARVVEASIAELHSGGPSRIEAPCPVYTDCGGCQWQQLSYEDQLAWKARLLEELARRIAPDVDFPLAEPVATPSPFGYRTRLQLAWDGRKRALGFMRERSHQVVPTEVCPIAHPLLEGVMAGLSRALAGLEPPLRFETVELEASTSEGAVRLFIPDAVRPDRAQAERLLETLGTPVAGVVLAQRRGRKPAVAGEAVLTHTTASGLTLRQSPGVFWQVNLEMNEGLVAEVVSQAEPGSGRVVVDLFCGAGNFTLPLALEGSEVIGIEADGQAVEDARWGLRNAGFTGWRLVAADAAEGLRKLLASRGRPHRVDTVVADPPRAGLKELVPLVARLGPERVVYVACEPASLFRDLAAFRSLGYRPARILPLDLFPQTAHLELVATLVRT
jgi:23S rRNA (uracil1939-C5)-methyltransferase